MYHTTQAYYYNMSSVAVAVAVFPRRSPRILELNKHQLHMNIKELSYELNVNRWVTIKLKNSRYINERANRAYHDRRIVRIYYIMITKFCLQYERYSSKIDNLLTTAYRKIPYLYYDYSVISHSTRNIKPVFNQYIKKYKSYQKHKILSVVLLTKRFPLDVVRRIAEYSLSSNNFVRTK